MILGGKSEHEKSILVEGYVWLTHLKLDFGAHTLCVSSTHEYYSHTKYELQSPTLSGSTRHNLPPKSIFHVQTSPPKSSIFCLISPLVIKKHIDFSMKIFILLRISVTSRGKNKSRYLQDYLIFLTLVFFI